MPSPGKEQEETLLVDKAPVHALLMKIHMSDEEYGYK